jgi:hypothetical protein
MLYGKPCNGLFVIIKSVKAVGFAQMIPLGFDKILLNHFRHQLLK